jgi:hypothetical protein
MRKISVKLSSGRKATLTEIPGYSEFPVLMVDDRLYGPSMLIEGEPPFFKEKGKGWDWIRKWNHSVGLVESIRQGTLLPPFREKDEPTTWAKWNEKMKKHIEAFDRLANLPKK